jgi:hypothetical protein
MKYVAVFLVGLVVGMILDVVIACLVVASEGEREQEDIEKYDGW